MLSLAQAANDWRRTVIVIYHVAPSFQPLICFMMKQTKKTRAQLLSDVIIKCHQKISYRWHFYDISLRQRTDCALDRKCRTKYSSFLVTTHIWAYTRGIHTLLLFCINMQSISCNSRTEPQLSYVLATTCLHFGFRGSSLQPRQPHWQERRDPHKAIDTIC